MISWGRADFGGDSSSVQDELRDVQQIQAAYGAFAAILSDGSVVTWGTVARTALHSTTEEHGTVLGPCWGPLYITAPS